MIVSINVPVIVTSPWRTGSFVFAAAAAIGAEPSPASLEKIPLAIPFCIDIAIEDNTPPATALTPKAYSIIVANAPGSFSILVTIKTNTATIYNIAINGTITWETLAILLIPPITTKPTQIANAKAVITIAIE